MNTTHTLELSIDQCPDQEILSINEISQEKKRIYERLKTYQFRSGGSIIQEIGDCWEDIGTRFILTAGLAEPVIRIIQLSEEYIFAPIIIQAAMVLGMDIQVEQSQFGYISALLDNAEKLAVPLLEHPILNENLSVAGKVGKFIFMRYWQLRKYI